jgi:uncharacterized protein YhhL (DUF1145 family)
MSACLYACLSYRAGKARVFCEVYCRIWLVLLYHMLPRCLLEGKISLKKHYFEKLRVLIFSTTFV